MIQPCKICGISDSKTLELFEYFDSIKEQGFLTKEQSLKILKWKSPRPLKHYNKNSNEDFEKITDVLQRVKDHDEKLDWQQKFDFILQ